MGLEREKVHRSNTGWSPVYVEDNLVNQHVTKNITETIEQAVMSVGFLLPSQKESVIWRGAKKNGTPCACYIC